MSGTMKLYEAAEALQITDEWLEEHGGELTPELEAAIEQAEGDFATKAERVALKVCGLEGEEEALEKEIARLARRLKARQNGIRSLKAYLQRQMEAAGKDKVNGLLVTISLQKNPEKLEVPAEIDLAKMPALFVREIPATQELAKDVVKLHLQAVAAGTQERNAGLPESFRLARSRSLRIR